MCLSRLKCKGHKESINNTDMFAGGRERESKKDRPERQRKTYM